MPPRKQAATAASGEAMSGLASLMELREANPGATIRVNIMTGMIERLPADQGPEAEWEDVREATPEELAAERETRADDFEEPPAPSSAASAPGAPREISEEAMADYTGTLERLAEETGIEADSLVSCLRDGMIEQFKQRRMPWGQMLAADQRDLAAALEFTAQTFARKAVAQIAARGRVSVRGKLKKFAHDGAKIMATIEIALTSDEVILAMNHASGKEVLIVTADADEFQGKRRDANIQDDERELEFEAGGDRPPPDDSDLANAAEASLTEPLESEEEEQEEEQQAQ